MIFTIKKLHAGYKSKHSLEYNSENCLLKTLSWVDLCLYFNVPCYFFQHLADIMCHQKMAPFTLQDFQMNIPILRTALGLFLFHRVMGFILTLLCSRRNQWMIILQYGMWPIVNKLLLNWLFFLDSATM